MNTSPPTSAQAFDALRQVMDPELDCNIVDLGLVYDITIGDGRALVTMSLTTPGCPMNEVISVGVEQALLALEGIGSVEVRIVWEPPWTPQLMSDAARRQVGLSETN